MLDSVARTCYDVRMTRKQAAALRRRLINLKIRGRIHGPWVDLRIAYLATAGQQDKR